MICMKNDKQTFSVRLDDQLLQIEPWGEDILRVRSTINAALSPGDWVLEQQPQGRLTTMEQDDCYVLRSGSLQCELQKSDGHLAFRNARSGALLLDEIHQIRAYAKEGRMFKRTAGELCICRAWFCHDENEHLYGLGQHSNGHFDQSGCVIDLEQKNSEIAVPFMLSSKSYGFFWNNPAQGRVELGGGGTRWIADASRQIDYFVVYGDTFGDIMRKYSTITGLPSVFPDWASGFWQCKLRYQTQQELIQVARKHHNLGLPMEVIVADFFHWTKQGEWKFDPACWPEPERMVSELKEMGIKLMVSIWPSVNPASELFDEMKAKNFLVNTNRGIQTLMNFEDSQSKDRVDVYYYDPTNAEALKFVFEQVKKNYLDLGIDIFWLDACEPECKPMDWDNMHYQLGAVQEIGGLYPYYHERGFYKHMKASGIKEPLNLCRSGWAGSQKYGAAIWSGDIDSTFEEFERQIIVGMHMACSGIPYWTTDIGGFYGGDIEDEEFRELVIRWFQWALFNPIFRLHGFRNSFDHKGGSDNEVWSFGEEAYGIIKQLLFLRERMRPYIMSCMDEASRSGLPPMRPLFFDFSKDERCYGIADQFLFGPDILVAPVYRFKQRERAVYLPEGTVWQNPFTYKTYEGGQTITVAAPLDRIPVFIREGKKAPFAE